MESDVEGMKGFIQVSDELSCAGQPTEDEFALVRRSGVRLVVNLALSESDFALPDERAVVEALGMDFVHIPVPFSAPTVQHFVQCESELLARHGQSVLVHCAYNWRASSFVALFAERHWGWTREKSERLRTALWSPDDTWNAWASAVRKQAWPSSHG